MRLQIESQDKLKWFVKAILMQYKPQGVDVESVIKDIQTVDEGNLSYGLKVYFENDKKVFVKIIRNVETISQASWSNTFPIHSSHRVKKDNWSSHRAILEFMSVMSQDYHLVCSSPIIRIIEKSVDILSPFILELGQYLDGELLPVDIQDSWVTLLNLIDGVSVKTQMNDVESFKIHSIQNTSGLMGKRLGQFHRYGMDYINKDTEHGLPKKHTNHVLPA